MMASFQFFMLLAVISMAGDKWVAAYGFIFIAIFMVLNQ